MMGSIDPVGGLVNGGFLVAASEFHHAHPEHEFAAGIDVVLAHVVEPAVGSDAEHRHAGGNVAHGGAVAHGQSRDVRSDQHAAASVDLEGAAVDAARVDGLDRLGL